MACARGRQRGRRANNAVAVSDGMGTAHANSIHHLQKYYYYCYYYYNYYLQLSLLAIVHFLARLGIFY